MQIKALTAVFVAVAISVALSSTEHAKALSPTSTTTNVNDKVKVAAGDTLSAIAKRHGTTYVRLFNANPKVSDPNLIFPGQVIRIPAANEKLPNRIEPVATTIPAPVSAPSSASQTSVSSVPAPAARSVAAPTSGIWNSLAQCESGGNWAVNTGNGYYGGLQFSLATWHSVGGSGYPHQASASEQIARAKILQARSGWGAWPACAAKLGLR